MHAKQIAMVNRVPLSDYYQVLGLNAQATPEELKSAYVNLGQPCLRLMMSDTHTQLLVTQH